MRIKRTLPSRKQLANPHANIPFEERLERSGAIDLRDNHKVIDHGNGYISVKPIDETKKFKAR